VPTGSLLLIYSRAMLFGAVSPILNITGQLICDFFVHVASPNKIVDRAVAIDDLQNHKCHGIMLLYI
jgi:hypothetical protein